jgi:hypothetical protein
MLNIFKRKERKRKKGKKEKERKEKAPSRKTNVHDSEESFARSKHWCSASFDILYCAMSYAGYCNCVNHK